MDRRRFLAGVSSTAALPLAGCSLPTDPAALTTPETYHDRDGGRFVYEYGPGDTEWAQYAVEFERRGRPNDAFEVALVVSGFELDVTDVRFLVEPALNVTGTAPPQTRYLAKSWPPVTVYRENGRTVLDVALDEPTDGTLHFTLEVDPFEGGARQTFVACEAAFEGDGPFERYTVSESAVYDLPEPRSA